MTRFVFGAILGILGMNQLENRGMKNIIYFVFPLFLFNCSPSENQEGSLTTTIPSNVLDYRGTPSSLNDRSSLAFSDRGAWFAYGFCDEENTTLGFSGPLLLAHGQGEWSSKALSHLELIDYESGVKLDNRGLKTSYTSYNSHLYQVFENRELLLEQYLFYNSPHSAIITTQITNLSDQTINLQPSWKGTSFSVGLKIAKEGNTISFTTDRNTSKGVIQTFGDEVQTTSTTDSSYSISLKNFVLKTNETKTLITSQTFIFPEYSLVKETSDLEIAAKTPFDLLQKRIQEKEAELETLNNKLNAHWQDPSYKNLVTKTVLTLQNNTRIGAGELKHTGIFPSYHYKWFLGFWAWDSWKHAVAVSHYNSELAKDQIRAMYDFQLDNGFILDCVFRDTTVEKHNYRNTKPPLSGWAVWEVYKQSGDVDFVKEMYPKILKQHNWWYAFRDYDKDGVCEYGSKDGTLKAAKWESGMDNAVRFDKSKMVENSDGAFSLNQESVDLNSYLYAEKLYLSKMAEVVGLQNDIDVLSAQGLDLKVKIQNQFFDIKTGWFYDTSMDGETFVDAMGCEGWIPLWVNVATKEQAEAVKDNMINPMYFNTKVPFQTLSASHPDFKPDRGYWRGPNWLDQAYFGVVGLHNYGYHEDAYRATYKLIHNAEGVLAKGTSIRENYQPLTGAGLESHNFSWSAAHYLLLLINE
jgi:putative isomerase